MTEERKGWLTRLKSRWDLPSLTDVIIVLIVFALTGTSVLVAKPYILDFIFGDQEISGWYSVLYYILILPVYNILLLIYGFIFGKFYFFWKFEKRFVKRIFGLNRK